ncbi:DUF323 domain-containing protein [Coprinopsis cinerea okayama7|uniref:DUF323 domain-containing protein n=1 Tax=Coprinopsis cinerea (strain Okayama-7 / 130 / ATCC MYA-4618 / FGSC 9003) TaxID=240176 RepID=D6RLM3_COPC7|nr:DUF323 domain-containing protein [Coprinopsis cinerea okayama7\|eukprot:XP_002911661.1 DUF323 domain-containing protein [Coprinopsis cinerea okayama7\
MTSYSSTSSSSLSSLSPPTSRATTPASEISDIQTVKQVVLVPSHELCPEGLRQLFSYYGGSVGLVVDRESPSQGDDHWERREADNGVPLHFKARHGFEELSRMSLLYISTSKEHARQLNIINTANLRSVVSTPLSPTRMLHILERPSFVFPPVSSVKSFSPQGTECRGNIPTLDEWRSLWKAWDTITLQMIPESMLHQKPIDLRHKCLFYIGHIPTFLDMLLSKSIGGKATEPAYFWNIFERGIDPHVDDPDYCHNHSEVPERDEDWPTLDTIISFRDGVRRRLMGLYEDLASGKRRLNRNIARTLVMTLEHEGFHVETLLYMLIQRAGSGTLPPPGFQQPEWSSLVEQWGQIPAPSTSAVVVGPAQLTMGHNDSEADDKLPHKASDIVDHTFGWDNESPARVVRVDAFKAEWRPITNAEYEAFCKRTSREELPKSWVKEDGENKVRTFYGPVSMAIAGDWPLLASYDELLDYARSKGGRLPTEPELRLFLDTYDIGHEGGANIGFRNWHPVPATTGISEFDGKGSNGGVWEWTSTLFDTHEGLVPTNIFPGYSADFFDTKHHVVLGASYATIPRLAERKTVRNFYQHNYPYPWAGARVVYDL